MDKIFKICCLVSATLIIPVLAHSAACEPDCVPQKAVVIPLFGADGNAMPEDVVKGKTFSNSSNKGLTGTLELKPEPSGTATSADVLIGKTFSNDTEVEANGAMVDNGSIIITPSTYTTIIPKGHHSGLGSVPGDNNLRSENIKAGIAIFGVYGDSNVVDTSIGDATSDDIFDGKWAWVGGQLIKGRMLDNGVMVFTPDTADQTIPQGYHPGTGFVQGDPDLKPENISKGVTIFGVVGTASFTYTDNGDGTVSQAGSRLMWQQGYNGARIDWEASNTYCNELELGGHADWRLPTLEELKSLVVCSNGRPVPIAGDTGCWEDGYDNYFTTPTIDPIFSCHPSRYWSSDDPWWVDFNYGWPGTNYLPWPNVRCVRLR